MNTGNEPSVPDEPSPGPPRDSRGNFIATIDHDERAARAARLKADNPKMGYREIAAAVGYSDPGSAWRAVDKCRKAVLQSAGAELIASEAALLDDQFVAAMEILERDHLVVSHGKVIKDDEGHPLLDDGPKLAALREMRAIRESYRKLFGVDAAAKVDVTGSVKYEVVGVNPEDLT
ncbi:hypothetical protein [Streptomyces sp. NPDC001139]